MSKKKSTEIVTIIDKSGSMKNLQGKTIEAFNEFLNEQKKIKEDANFSLILFSSPNKENIVFDSIDIKKVTELDENIYDPIGTTALYDCIGKTIKSLKKRIKNLNEEEKPERVLFVIITDGFENSSRIFDKNKIFKMINKREEKNKWNFIYLGANQDSFVEGGKIGIKKGRILDFLPTENGVNYAYNNISNFTKSYRTIKSFKNANNLNFNDILKKYKDKK